MIEQEHEAGSVEILFFSELEAPGLGRIRSLTRILWCGGPGGFCRRETAQCNR